MKRKLITIALSISLICTIGVSAMALESDISESAAISENVQQLPDSVLYYGQIKEIIKDENGTISKLWLESERYGEYIMNVSAETVWIDSGNKNKSDFSDLREGESLYIFHSSMSTRSLPPQSNAFAVVRNIPQDVGCAKYHQVESVNKHDGNVIITTDNGSLLISVGDNTEIKSYSNGDILTADAIKAGDYVMAWYSMVAASYPGQTNASCLMVIDKAEPKVLNRAELVNLLYEAEGKPVVESSIKYTDVSDDDPCEDAISWASTKGIVSGYGDGLFGPNDDISREQLITILWRYSGSPVLMGYTGLSQFEDVSEISRFAQQAMSWAHQKRLIASDGVLDPKGTATMEEAVKILELIK